jgi:hypothetical protein
MATKKATKAKKPATKKAVTRKTTKAAPARKMAAADVPNLFRINIEVGNLDEAADFYAHLLAQPGRK